MARELPDQVGSHVERIYTEAQRAAKIVQNLISFAWRRRPEKQHMEVTAVLQRALELKSYDFKVNNIEVSTQWDCDLPYTMVDEYQMTQAIINIMHNPEQAMYEAHQGGQLTVHAVRSEDKIKISIADDGPGIFVEHLRKIFDPFFTTREVGSGTGLGLGLGICYGVIRQHGGTIWAESVPDGGTTVCITLPISGSRSREDSESVEAFVSAKHLLVIEDEPHLRDLLADALAIEHNRFRILQVPPYRIPGNVQFPGYMSLSHKPGSVSDIVNKSHLVAITDSNLCVLRQLSSSL